jgi:hypothetical protein
MPHLTLRKTSTENDVVPLYPHHSKNHRIIDLVGIELLNDLAMIQKYTRIPTSYYFFTIEMTSSSSNTCVKPTRSKQLD